MSARPAPAVLSSQPEQHASAVWLARTVAIYHGLEGSPLHSTGTADWHRRSAGIQRLERSVGQPELDHGRQHHHGSGVEGLIRLYRTGGHFGIQTAQLIGRERDGCSADFSSICATLAVPGTGTIHG